ncbi:MAG TPA: hypothetical protein VER17_13160 [Tepidisphaeraceae bacterium]|nr:hypothetical protein [Tepidisphaeraceae bacterium]
MSGPDGHYGTIDTTCWPSRDEIPDPEVDLRLPDGSHITIAADVLIEQKDGSYYIPLHQRELDAIPHHPKAAPGTDDCWPCRRKNHDRTVQAETGSPTGET